MCTLPRWASAVFLLCALSMAAEAADIHTASDSKGMYIAASADLTGAFDVIGMSGELDIGNAWIGLATLAWKNDARTEVEQIRICDALEMIRAAKHNRSDHEPCGE